MNGLHKQTSFSWKRGFFASQLEGLDIYNALTKDKAQKLSKSNAPTLQKMKIRPNGNLLWPRLYHRRMIVQWQLIRPLLCPDMYTQPLA